MGSEVEAVSSEPQVTVLVSVVVFMCLSWILQYYKGLFQTLLCVLKYFFSPQICSQGNCSPTENGGNLLVSRNVSEVSKVRQ